MNDLQGSEFARALGEVFEVRFVGSIYKVLWLLSSGFSVMLFHCDSKIDQWKRFWWNDWVVNISPINQTKWWFAKRFMHPDVVAAYEYIFLWDEDLGVDNFDPLQYMSIVKEEGLQISQPARNGNKSEVHHQITARGRRGNVHRRMYKHGEYDEDSTGPPCTGDWDSYYRDYSVYVGEIERV